MTGIKTERADTPSGAGNIETCNICGIGITEREVKRSMLFTGRPACTECTDALIVEARNANLHAKRGGMVR